MEYFTLFVLRNARRKIVGEYCNKRAVWLGWFVSLRKAEGLFSRQWKICLGSVGTAKANGVVG